jgi:Rieske Fe-S protein
VRQGPADHPLPVFEVRMDGDRVMVGPQVNQEAETI